MNTEKSIPIVVGVTGHRRIREQDRAELYRAVSGELLRIRENCPNSPVVMLNSLCEGADLLCADAARELGIPIIAALPLPAQDLQEDYSSEEWEHFSDHCAGAEEIFVVPETESLPENGAGREYRYRQASIYVSLHSHILIALWDGNPGAGFCGTAETVEFALHGSFAPAAGVSPRSENNEAVIHIHTPRTDSSQHPAGEVRILGSRAEISDILKKTDEFNRGSGETGTRDSSILPADVAADTCLSRMENVDWAAELMSTGNAKRFRLTLALLAVAGAVLTFAFLMYDEAGAIWMILVCGLMLACAWGLSRFAARSDCHRRYLEYRVLAECLRVQIYLRYSGSRILVSQLIPWTQQAETAWILCALCALEIGPPPKEVNSIRECWAEGQWQYHASAGKRSRQKFLGSERIVLAALILSIALYLGAVVFELVCGGLFFSPAITAGNVETYRTILKILLGTISVVTLFIANYYGRLSLERTCSDHQKMEKFYEKMSSLLSVQGQTDQLLTVLAREELIENGNWCSYQRGNKPDINI